MHGSIVVNLYNLQPKGDVMGRIPKNKAVATNSNNNTNLFINTANIREDVMSIVRNNINVSQQDVIELVDNNLKNNVSTSTLTRRRNLVLSMLDEVRNEAVQLNRREAKREAKRMWNINNREHVRQYNLAYRAKMKAKNNTSTTDVSTDSSNNSKNKNIAVTKQSKRNQKVNNIVNQVVDTQSQDVSVVVKTIKRRK